MKRWVEDTREILAIRMVSGNIWPVLQYGHRAEAGLDRQMDGSHVVEFAIYRGEDKEPYARISGTHVEHVEYLTDAGWLEVTETPEPDPVEGDEVTVG